VDLPNGGVAQLVNDAIIQGPANTNGALVIVGGESATYAPSSLTVNNSIFTGDGSPSSVGIQEFGGCIAPPSGTGNTFTSLGANVSPSGCGSLGSGDPPGPVVDAPEPSSWLLLLTAFAGLSLTYLLPRPRR
jgi:hypothetical protein